MPQANRCRTEIQQDHSDWQYLCSVDLCHGLLLLIPDALTHNAICFIDFDHIIAEDIIDTGRTLNDVLKLLKARNPLSLKVITLLDKPERRLVKLDADISLFTIPDHFVIGYGLDCGEIYRNLPYIAEYDEGEEV